MYNYTELITNRLSDLVQEKKEFILYPFGERGKLAKAILNVCFDIEEVMIIDNKLSEKYQNIYGLDSLKDVDFEDKMVLITSDNPVIHKDICELLYQYVSKEHCVELFPDIIESQTANKNDEEKRRRELINQIQRKELIDNLMIYHPKNTKSEFFLPYVFTDHIQSTIFLSDDYYDRNNLDKVFQYDNGMISRGIKEESCFVDIGANIGNHTLYFVNELSASNVISFEPVEETYWILEKNIEIHELGDKVELHKAGVSDHKANAKPAWYHMDNTGGTALSENETGEIFLVTLDSINLKNVYFIKIDVEGMEDKVLLGGIETIKEYHPYIMIESFSPFFTNVKKILGEIGYRYEVLTEGSDYLFVYEDNYIT